MTQKLLLFDLDWTLIYTGGAGLRALNHAFERLYGIREAAQRVALDGKTDPAICREMIQTHDQRPARQEEIQALCEAYLERLAIEVPQSPGYRIMPGIPPLLEALAPRTDCLLALGTGNLKKGAEIKLARPGFWKYFPIGGFSDDSEIRPEVLRKAVERGEAKAGQSFPPKDVVVIGDTIHDIHAGQAIGATTVAVACGPTKADVLAAQKPDYVFNDLSETDKVIQVLTKET